jgi:hypothetical protein
VTWTRIGGQRLFALLLAVLVFPVSLRAQTADETLRTSLGELREADYATKEAIVERLGASGHASTQAANRLLEDRLYIKIGIRASSSSRWLTMRCQRGAGSRYADGCRHGVA